MHLMHLSIILVQQSPIQDARKVLSLFWWACQRPLRLVASLPMAVGVIQPTWSDAARANTTMKSRSVIDKQTWRHLVAGWLRTSAGSGSTEAQVAEQCSVFQRTVQRIKAKIRSEELRYPWSCRSWSLRTPGNTAAV